MKYAEGFANPVAGELGPHFSKTNDAMELFYLRWGRIYFDVFWGVDVNVKVILKVYREHNTCEYFIVDTEPYEVGWNQHKRMTRDFYVHPFSAKLGRITCVKLSFVAHSGDRSIPSEYDYIYMEGYHFEGGDRRYRHITREHITQNWYTTHEVDANRLQSDVDWYNHHYESLGLVPKFTKGQVHHPYHPKQYIHEHIDKMIHRKWVDPNGFYAIKVCVDCIDDTDFINHLIHARNMGVFVQCIVDWKKMVLTNSENYARLKFEGIDLLGVFCTPEHPIIEVSPDMHNKFIIFGDEDCILGSFNITFDRWWANWETGMTFHSRGICRLLDNIFQSVRGGVIQKYGIDPRSHFNLLYTFGRHQMLNGKPYRPHDAIMSEINRAQHSIKLCVFLIGELRGEYGESVIDALIGAKHRGVDVHIILNGHVVREGDPGVEYPMHEELRRPVIPAVGRLKHAGIPVALTYGQEDQRVPYCPLHSKYCIVDETVVLEGSFNWYNTSVYSHDHINVVANRDVAGAFVHEFYQILRLFRVYY